MAAGQRLDGPTSLIFSLRDLERFAAVCRPWRAAASRQPARAFAPLLLLSSSDDDSSGTKHLCGPNDAWVFRAPSKAVNMRTVGSQDGGWVALLDTENYTLAVMNLFSGVEVTLSPEQSNIASICSAIMPCVSKVIFSGDPSSSNGCILAAIIERYLRITLCKVGGQDCRWTTWGDEKLMDIAFYNRELYGLTRSTGELIKFEIGIERDCSLIVTAIQRLDIHSPTCYDDTEQYISYIFELHGKLSLAVNFRWPNLDAFFRVFKLDVDEAYKHVWIEVTSLGDYALFIGPRCSKAVHVPFSAEHRGQERNHIYYTIYTYSTMNELPKDAVYEVRSDDGEEIKMYCKKDLSSRDGMKRTGNYVNGWNHGVWVHPPDL